MKYLKIHSLEKGWKDRDLVLLHAAFQILVDFIEQEEPENIIDWSSDPAHKAAWQELSDLYRWWTIERPNRAQHLHTEGLVIPPIEATHTAEATNKTDSTSTTPNVDLSVKADEEKYAAFFKAAEAQRTLDQTYHEEDQLNLHRLIDVRPYLWT